MKKQPARLFQKLRNLSNSVFDILYCLCTSAHSIRLQNNVLPDVEQSREAWNRITKL